MAEKEVSVGFVAKTASFNRDIRSLGNEVMALKRRIDSTVNAAARPLKILGGAISSIGGSGAAALGMFTKSAITLETQMRNVNSILKGSEGQYNSLKQQILDLSPTVPKSAEDLAGAAYQIVSSG